MRFEIHLFLWVTAFAVAGAGLFVGMQGESQLGSKDTAENRNFGDIERFASEQDTLPEIGISSVLPEINTSSRSIFPAAGPSIILDVVSLEADILPSLVGIFSSEGPMTAVMSGAPGGAYKLVREGSVIGNFAITDISAQAVVVKNASDGTLSTILLRGAGELP